MIADPVLTAEDIVHIQQVIALYGHVLDAAQWERFREVFSEDAEADYSRGGVAEPMRGVDAIADFFRGVNHPSAHHCVNVHVYVEDGETRVRSKFLAPYTRPTHDQPRWKGGIYEDVVVRTDAGWRISSRTCIATWQFAHPRDEDLPTW